MNTTIRMACGGLLAIVIVAFCSQAQRSASTASDRKDVGQNLAQSRGASPRLVDITASTGIHFKHLASSDKKYIVESMSGGVALIDYDRDGWPDIYLTNAPDVDMQLAGKKARSALFHNDRNGTFTDVTDKAGVAYPCWANGATVGDFNNDAWPDLAVTCFGGVVLFRNNGDGTFADVTRAAGLGTDSLWAMGAAFGDYDLDGLEDLFVSHYAALDLHNLPAFGSMVNCQYYMIKVQCGPAGLEGSPDNLFHNNGNGTFTDVSKQTGADDPQKLLGLTAVWSDLDNDGKPDLFVANDGAQNYLYKNNGAGHFTELGYQAGVALAVVPNVTVTIRDVEKNLEKTVVTNESGVYDSGPLVPSDRYLITFKKEGFSSVQRGPMTLTTGITGLNAELTVGQSTQTVTIQETAAPLLETATAELSTTIGKESLTTLPQVGTPDWQQFIVLLPGTRGTPQNGNQTSNPGMGGVSVDGSMPFSNALLDGVSTSSPMSNNVINTPIFDSIAEVKITNSLGSAQYGTGGILYNQISKGGTNQFHGLGYDYFRNTALNAANFQFGLNVQRAPIHYNAFGGNIGGPIIKNRAFFFFAIENVINHGGASVNLTTVPTNAMRSGDFTGFNTIYDPTAQVVNPTTGVVTRQPFAGNKIPDRLIDPVAKSIQNLIPASNLSGTLANGGITNNYNYGLPSSSPLRKYFGRFDADVTPNNRISGSAAWNDAPAIGLSPICPVNCVARDIFNTNNQISDYWSISPSTMNEFRLGFMGEYDLLTPQTLGQGWPAKIGMQYAKADIFPTINITSFFNQLQPGVNANYKENLFDLSDQVTLVRGRHILHFGGEVLINRADSTAWGNINAATLGFTGVYTAGSNVGALASSSGSPYADFLLGYAKSWSAAVSPEYGGRMKNPGVFVQDDFKLSPKLTLNLGLRWEGNTGWSEIHGNARSFDPNIINPATNKPGAMWYAINGTNGRTSLQAAQWKNFLPRIGFAYMLGNNMTIRGGFGMYTYPWNVDTYAGGLGTAFTASGSQTDSTNNAQPVVILGSDGNTNYQGARGSSVNALYGVRPPTPDAYNGQAVGFTQYTSPIPLLKSWNLTVQRTISSNTFVDVGYIGSHGSHLPWNTDLNQVPERLLGPNDAAFRPYSAYQSITGVTTDSLSNYHALQMGITRRMTSGLMFNFNYTWSKMLSTQDSSGWGSKQGNTPWQRAYNPDLNYGPSNFDIRHLFKGQVIYDLPFGTGRAFVNQNKALDQVIGGWRLSGTIVAQTGNPFTPYMATNNSYSLAANNNVWYPNVVGNPNYENPTIDSWFNVGALAAPAAGTFGNMGRNILYGPGMTQVNMSLQKTFSITERIKFDFSANSTNALNHPSFGPPDLLVGPGHVGKITTTQVGGRQMELIGKIRF